MTLLLASDQSDINQREEDLSVTEFDLRNAADDADVVFAATGGTVSGNVLFLARAVPSGMQIRAFRVTTPAGTNDLIEIGTGYTVPNILGVTYGRGIWVSPDHGITNQTQLAQIRCLLPARDTDGFGYVVVAGGRVSGTIRRINRLGSSAYNVSGLPLMTQVDGRYAILGTDEQRVFYAMDRLGGDVPADECNQWEAPNPVDRIAHTGLEFYGEKKGFFQLGQLSGNDWEGFAWNGSGYAALNEDGRYGTVSGNTFTQLGQLSGTNWFGLAWNGSSYAAMNFDGPYGTLSGNTFTRLGQLSGNNWFGFAWNGSGYVALNDDGRYGFPSGNWKCDWVIDA